MASFTGRSVPIPIRRTNPGTNAKGPHIAQADGPQAPVIGSLQAPSHISDGIPDLDLPPQSPEAFSLAEIATAEYTQRLVGVSSAPARTFIEAARRAGVPPGTSPTVLSILQQKATFEETPQIPVTGKKAPGLLPLGRNSDVESLSGALARFSVGSLPAGNAFAKQMIPSSAAPSHGTQGGLAAALRGPGGARPGGMDGMAQAPAAGGYDPAPLVGSLGRKMAAGGVVLAASFRDAGHMPVPLPMTEEGDVEDDSSEDESNRMARRRAEARRAGPGIAGRGPSVDERDEDEDEEEASAAARRADRDTREDGVFDSDL